MEALTQLLVCKCAWFSRSTRERVAHRGERARSHPPKTPKALPPPPSPTHNNVQRYKAAAHPGKGFPRQFMTPGCPARNTYKQLAALTSLQAQLDPNRRLEPDLFAYIRNGTVAQSSPGCVARHECWCSVDSDCPPFFPYTYVINPLATPPVMGNAAATFKCVKATSVRGYSFGVCIPQMAN